ncbi:hypothetical protein [Natronococcus occultus]|uniref:Uncharacterized protein n=1 Tax=Natronococcus occultus SP4 TaxID=694430 RepID=L0JXA7_9EURY|nr:hypothetical protein [Natronococcus occultus]AGB36493.1 hypothetical protein Natoc_0633 [Natronococcus occultus SP4]
MGLLDLMFGRSGEGQQGIEGHSYKLPEENHEFVYPVAVRRIELEALEALLAADEAAPSLADNADELQDTFDELFDGDGPDATAVADREREARGTVERVLETWREQVPEDDDGIGVVYVQQAEFEAIRAFVKRCTDRDERYDEFELPESMPAVAALLARLGETTDSRYRAVVHTDLLPEA